MFKKLVTNDDAVKKIFDHFRNVGIAGAIFAAGIWNMQHPTSGALSFLNWPCSIALCALGVLLLAVVERHGHHQLKEANLPIVWELGVIILYGLSLFWIFAAAAMRIELH